MPTILILLSPSERGDQLFAYCSVLVRKEAHYLYATQGAGPLFIYYSVLLREEAHYSHAMKTVGLLTNSGPPPSLGPLITCYSVLVREEAH